MNINALAKLYDRLVPCERLPLIIAAVDRGDDAEADRLSRSAPRIHVGLPDYHGLAEGLLLQSLFHTIGQLDLGLLFWHAQGMVADWEEFAVSEEDKSRADRLWDLIRFAGYRLCVEADAWTRLCVESKIDPETVLRDLPAYNTMQFTEKAAREFACTPEEAAAYLRRRGPGDAEPPTVEGATKIMRHFIDQRIAWWDGSG